MNNSRWFRKQFLRRGLIILALLLQIVLIVDVILDLSRYSPAISALHTTASLAVALHIASRKDKGAFKTSWIVLVLVLPLFGGVLYLLFNFQSSTRTFQKDVRLAEEKSKELLSVSEAYTASAIKDFPECTAQIRYLQDYAGFPIYRNTQASYLTPGEQMLDALIPELEKAERYIFIETFILEEGIMWDRILEVLKRKAQEGVTVRIIYDDVGCFLTLPQDYDKQLQKYVIKGHTDDTGKDYLVGDHERSTLLPEQIRVYFSLLSIPAFVRASCWLRNGRISTLKPVRTLCPRRVPM